MLYADTSAFLKLFVHENHSDDLRAATRGTLLCSSLVLDVEAHRAVRRLGVPSAQVPAALEKVAIIVPSASTFALARDLPPAELGTLDALHLATALELGDDVDAVLTYDRRLAAASELAGLSVMTPGLRADWWR